MPTFNIYGVASISTFLGTVEAATEEEALALAYDDDDMEEKSYISLCHECAKYDLGDVYYEAEEIK